MLHMRRKVNINFESDLVWIRALLALILKVDNSLMIIKVTKMLLIE